MAKSKDPKKKKKKNIIDLEPESTVTTSYDPKNKPSTTDVPTKAIDLDIELNQQIQNIQKEIKTLPKVIAYSTEAKQIAQKIQKTFDDAHSAIKKIDAAVEAKKRQWVSEQQTAKTHQPLDPFIAEDIQEKQAKIQELSNQIKKQMAQITPLEKKLNEEIYPKNELTKEHFQQYVSLLSQHLQLLTEQLQNSNLQTEMPKAQTFQAEYLNIKQKPLNSTSFSEMVLLYKKLKVYLTEIQPAVDAIHSATNEKRQTLFEHIETTEKKILSNTNQLQEKTNENYRKELATLQESAKNTQNEQGIASLEQKLKTLQENYDKQTEFNQKAQKLSETIDSNDTTYHHELSDLITKMEKANHSKEIKENHQAILQLESNHKKAVELNQNIQQFINETIGNAHQKIKLRASPIQIKTDKQYKKDLNAVKEKARQVISSDELEALKTEVAHLTQKYQKNTQLNQNIDDTLREINTFHQETIQNTESTLQSNTNTRYKKDLDSIKEKATTATNQDQLNEFNQSIRILKTNYEEETGLNKKKDTILAQINEAQATTPTQENTAKNHHDNLSGLKEQVNNASRNNIDHLSQQLATLISDYNSQLKATRASPDTPAKPMPLTSTPSPAEQPKEEISNLTQDKMQHIKDNINEALQIITKEIERLTQKKSAKYPINGERLKTLTTIQTTLNDMTKAKLETKKEINELQEKTKELIDNQNLSTLSTTGPVIDKIQTVLRRILSGLHDVFKILTKKIEPKLEQPDLDAVFISESARAFKQMKTVLENIKVEPEQPLNPSNTPSNPK